MAVSELIDGNNVLGRLGGSSRQSLLTELAQLARTGRKKLVVVFDGPPEHGRPKVQVLGDVTVVCAAPLTADEEIVRRVREARDPRGVTVVTDDGSLCNAVRAAGGRTIGVQAFQGTGGKRLARKAAEEELKPNPLGGVRDWERWFSDPRNRLR